MARRGCSSQCYCSHIFILIITNVLLSWHERLAPASQARGLIRGGPWKDADTRSNRKIAADARRPQLGWASHVPASRFDSRPGRRRTGPRRPAGQAAASLLPYNYNWSYLFINRIDNMRGTAPRSAATRSPCRKGGEHCRRYQQRTQGVKTQGATMMPRAARMRRVTRWIQQNNYIMIVN